MQGKGSLEGRIPPKLPEGVSVAKCVLRVCINAVSGTSVGWGRAQERQRPEITDCTETKERQGLGDAEEGKGWEKKNVLDREINRRKQWEMTKEEQSL